MHKHTRKSIYKTTWKLYNMNIEVKPLHDVLGSPKDAISMVLFGWVEP